MLPWLTIGFRNGNISHIPKIKWEIKYIITT